MRLHVSVGFPAFVSGSHRGWWRWRRSRKQPVLQPQTSGSGASAAVGASQDIEAGAADTPRATEEDAPPQLTRTELVEEFFRTLFPDDFQLALPVKKHKASRVFPRVPLAAPSWATRMWSTAALHLGQTDIIRQPNVPLQDLTSLLNPGFSCGCCESLAVLHDDKS